MSNIKLVVKSVDGVRKTLTPQEFAQFKLVPGMKVSLLDASTGQAPAKLQAKRLAQDLTLEVAGESIKLPGFYDTPQVDFYPQGEAAAGVLATGTATGSAAPSAGFPSAIRPVNGLAAGVCTGMIAGAAVYAELFPFFKSTVLSWSDFGKIGLADALGINHWIIAIIFTVITLVMFRWFEKKGL